MPLVKSGSDKAFQQNVRTEMDSNPEKSKRAQNLAIAYAVKRRFAKKKMAMGGEVNEDLDPEHEPSGLTETQNVADEHLGRMAEEHEELMEPAEPTDAWLEPAAEDRPAKMAKGGMFDSMNVARDIRSKGMSMKGGVHAKRFAEGGMAEAESTDRPEDGESIDNFRSEMHPDNDFLSGEEDSPYFNPNQADLREPDAKARRSMMMERVMRNLQKKHMGK